MANIAKLPELVDRPQVVSQQTTVAACPHLDRGRRDPGCFAAMAARKVCPGRDCRAAFRRPVVIGSYNGQGPGRCLARRQLGSVTLIV